MKKLLFTSIAILLAWPAHAEEVDRTVDADSDGHVHVSNIAGSVKVEGWDRNQVKITGSLGRNVKELYVDSDGDEVVIKVKVPRHGGRGINSDLYINVPRGSSIDIGTVSADITVNDVDGDQQLQSVSGDVDATYASDDMAAESVSGDVEIRGNNSDGDVEVSSVSGDVSVFRVSGDVSAESVSGSVTVDTGSFDDISLDTVNGRILFQGELRKDGRLDAETVNGGIDLDFTGSFSADVDVETLNGRIKNCFGHEAEKTSKYGPGWELSFTEGRGSARVKVSSVNGGVNICKD